MGIQLSTQLLHAMNHVNSGHRVGSFQLPEPNGLATGQITPELIRSSTRLTTKHIADLPATAECRFQPPSAITGPRPQHSQPFARQARKTSLADGFRCGQDPGMNQGSCQPGCRRCGGQLPRANGKKQMVARKSTVREITDCCEQ
tara:strand:+ start:63 stop:497 length:435 start_codon:yes stop_codon:yes gene_type:complete